MTDYCMVIEINCSESPHIYTLIYILYILMYNNHIQGHQDKNKKQKNPQKQETQQSDRNMIKHDKRD